MATDERGRRELEGILESCLGERGARLLMAELPPQGWHDFATNSDVALLQRSMQAEMRALDAGLRVEIAGLRTDVTNDIAGLRVELHRVMFGVVGAVAGLLSLFEFVIR